jgi:nucleotidyltransferase/DNA polymerase involved in DNA repair
MDLDTFFVSVERKNDSRLENKPILVGGVGDRGVVVHAAMKHALLEYIPACL